MYIIEAFDIGPVYRYSDFAIPFDELDFVVDDYDYYAELRDTKGELIADFEIQTGIDLIIMKLRRDVLDLIKDGTYIYDLKRVKRDETAWQSIIARGNFVIVSGATRKP